MSAYNNRTNRVDVDEILQLPSFVRCWAYKPALSFSFSTPWQYDILRRAHVFSETLSSLLTSPL
jgi:hypothetical protein